MFTGIIKHQGFVQKKTGSRLQIKVEVKLMKELSLGSSIAVNGVCLTVSKISAKTTLEMDLLPETLRRTRLGNLRPGSLVNLELPLKAGGRLGGHFVQGHIDGIAKVKNIKRMGRNYIFNFSAPQKLLKYMAEKGSLAVDGVSLTLIKAAANGFSVGIVPYTWRETTFRQLKAEEKVNIEIDILAKYVYKFTNRKKI